MVNGKCWTIKLCLNFRPRILRTSVKLARNMLLNFFFFFTIKMSYYYNSGDNVHCSFFGFHQQDYGNQN